MAKPFVVGGKCRNGHDLIEDNIRMEGSRVRCRTCTSKTGVKSRPRNVYEIGGRCNKGHLLEENNTYQHPSGKLICKICRMDWQRVRKGKEPIGTLGIWNKYKTHCSQGHEYSDENTYNKADGSRGCRACMKDVAHRQRIKKYNLQEDEYNKYLSLQGNKCAGCLTKFASTPHIDHCHATGKVRGLLCDSCNYGLGCFKDSPEVLRRMADYLEKSLVES